MQFRIIETITAKIMGLVCKKSEENVSLQPLIDKISIHDEAIVMLSTRNQ
jgi:hypothetical protein